MNPLTITVRKLEALARERAELDHAARKTARQLRPVLRPFGLTLVHRMRKPLAHIKKSGLSTALSTAKKSRAKSA